MKRALLVLLLLANVSYGQIPLSLKGEGVSVVKVDKVIIVKEDLTVVKSFPFTVSAAPGAGLYFWSLPVGVQSEDLGDSVKVTAAPKGSLTISLKAISPKLDKDGKFLGFLTQFGTVTFAVGDVPPPPPVPPEPKPPDPPQPADDPFGAGGLRVLIVYESAKTLTLGQHSVIYGKKVRDYLQEKCVIGPDGKTKEFRIYDQDLDVSRESQVWQRAMKRARTSLPWLVVGNGKAFYEGPIEPTATVDDVLAILKKYGG